MHDELVPGIPDTVWVHVLPNGNKVWDELVPAMDDVIHMHDALLPQPQATIAAQAAALDALSQSIGADPTTIADTVRQAVADKLAALQITVS